MKETYKFSIIVPIYNSSKYLHECLQSIISQSFKNYEIILIDDGSTDNSLSICKEYKKKFNNIIIKSKKNGGVSSARNVGIGLSRGKYLIFVDSDDIMSSDMLSVVNDNIDNNDLLVFGYFKKYLNKSKKFNSNNNYNLFEKKNLIYTDENVSGYLWNKVFKKSILVENMILFDTNIHYSEDLLFINEYLKYTNSIYFETKALYQYRMRKNSVTYDFYNEKNLSILKSLNIVINENIDNKVVYNQLSYDYVKSYYRLRKIIKKTNYQDVNFDILNLEKKIMLNRNFKEKILFFLSKYCFSIYKIIKKIKNSKDKLFD